MLSLHAASNHLRNLVCVDLCLREIGQGPFQGQPATCPPLRLKHFGHLPLALDNLSVALLFLGNEGQSHV